MAYIPIAVPINTTKTRDCIIEEGVRYCESSNISSKEIGFVLLATLALMIWVGFWMWLAEKYYDLFPVVFFGGGIGIPLLIGGLFLIFN